MTSNSGEVENANIIESARNADGVGSIRIRDVYLISGEQGATQAETGDAGETENTPIISKMTLQGVSAQANSSAVGGADLDGANVRTRINVGDIVDASKTYVVLGDGANGANGNDGSSTGSSGYNGGNGGKAGQVGSTGYMEGETNSKTAQVFYGIDGVGGNGGNGADGKNATGRYYGELSEGGWGGGAYGLDGAYYTLNTTNDPGAISFNENAYSTRLLSNRRQVDAETVMLDGTSRSALGGSGGSGGLGYIYYNTTSEKIKNAFNGGESVGTNHPWEADRKALFYPGAEDAEESWGAPDSVITYYCTAAAGGTAGVRYCVEDKNVAYKGLMGSSGSSYDPLYDNFSVARGTVRGKTREYGGVQNDDSPAAQYSYYWADHHRRFADEFLFGNLQFIPAFSHWNINTSYALISPDNSWEDGYYYQIPSGYSDKYDYTKNGGYDFGGVLVDVNKIKESGTGDNPPPPAQLLLNMYKIYLENYIKFNNKTLDDGNTWKSIFYGGRGCYWDDLEKVFEDSAYSYIVGGTSYTREIYGYVKRVRAMAGTHNTPGNIQFFFSRNDMVTSGGYYGTAQGLSSPARTALA